MPPHPACETMKRNSPLAGGAFVSARTKPIHTHRRAQCRFECVRVCWVFACIYMWVWMRCVYVRKTEIESDPANRTSIADGCCARVHWVCCVPMALWLNQPTHRLSHQRHSVYVPRARKNAGAPNTEKDRTQTHEHCSALDVRAQC